MDEPELTKPTNRKTHDQGMDHMLRIADQIAEEVGLDWKAEAACGSSDLPPDYWFPTGKSLEEKARATEAASVCFSECPVRLSCLKAACIAKEQSGIWGGLPSSVRRGDRKPYSQHDYDALAKLDNPYE